jgi:hypothetical protein
VEIDPSFSKAWGIMAYIETGIYDIYERNNAQLLEQAIEHAEHGRALDPEMFNSYHALSYIYLLKRDETNAIEHAKTITTLDPNNVLGYTQAGLVYFVLGKYAEAIPWFDEALRRKPDDLHTHYNLAIAYHCVKNITERKAAAISALPYFERHLALRPEDERMHDHYVALLLFADVRDRAEHEALKIIGRENVDANSAYNAACTFVHMERYGNAIIALERAIERGFTAIDFLEKDEDFAPLRPMKDFQDLIKNAKLQSAD